VREAKVTRHPGRAKDVALHHLFVGQAIHPLQCRAHENGVRVAVLVPPNAVAAVAGIVNASNDADRDELRSPGVEVMPGVWVGAVGVAPRPHAIATAATKMAKYPRTLD
jgi:hypothetical protein